MNSLGHKSFSELQPKEVVLVPCTLYARRTATLHVPRSPATLLRVASLANANAVQSWPMPMITKTRGVACHFQTTSHYSWSFVIGTSSNGPDNRFTNRDSFKWTFFGANIFTRGKYEENVEEAEPAPMNDNI